MTKQSESKAAKIRALLADGQKPKAVAAVLDVPVSYVYGVNHYAKQKAKTARAKIKQPASKRKETPTQLISKAVLRDMKQELKALHSENIRLAVEVANTRPPMYVDMPVPQPFSHYSFWQRLRILFLGRAA
jgi:uncharacterized protein YcbX